MDLESNKENLESNDIFDKYIVYDPNSSVEVEEDINENKAQSKVKAKKEQFNLITDTMNEHDNASKSDEALNNVWELLCDRLNALGPPTFTTSQWKKKWTSHKYNVSCRKRKSNTNVAVVPTKVIRIDRSPSVSNSSSTGVDVETVRSVALDSKTDQLLEAVMKNQGIMIEKLETSNCLLRELVKAGQGNPQDEH